MTSWIAANMASLSFTIYQSLFKLMSTESVMPSSHLILCHPLLLLPSIFSQHQVSSNESTLHVRWPKYWSFSISPPNEYSGLISFRVDWFDLFLFKGLSRILSCYNILTPNLYPLTSIHIQTGVKESYQ